MAVSAGIVRARAATKRAIFCNMESDLLVGMVNGLPPQEDEFRLAIGICVKGG
jgi:hypothetical protein